MVLCRHVLPLSNILYTSCDQPWMIFHYSSVHVQLYMYKCFYATIETVAKCMSLVWVVVKYIWNYCYICACNKCIRVIAYFAILSCRQYTRENTPSDISGFSRTSRYSFLKTSVVEIEKVSLYFQYYNFITSFHLISFFFFSFINIWMLAFRSTCVFITALFFSWLYALLFLNNDPQVHFFWFLIHCSVSALTRIPYIFNKNALFTHCCKFHRLVRWSQY